MAENFRRYPRPDAGQKLTPEGALEIIRYLTGEWLSNPATFGSWAGGAYMESLYKLAADALRNQDTKAEG